MLYITKLYFIKPMRKCRHVIVQHQTRVLCPHLSLHEPWMPNLFQLVLLLLQFLFFGEQARYFLQKFNNKTFNKTKMIII